MTLNREPQNKIKLCIFSMQDRWYFSKTTANNPRIPPSVDRYTIDSQSQHIGQGVDRVPTDILADMSTDIWPTCRPSISRYVGQECRPTEVFITHDPNFLNQKYHLSKNKDTYSHSLDSLTILKDLFKKS